MPTWMRVLFLSSKCSHNFIFGDKCAKAVGLQLSPVSVSRSGLALLDGCLLLCLTNLSPPSTPQLPKTAAESSDARKRESNEIFVTLKTQVNHEPAKKRNYNTYISEV